MAVTLSLSVWSPKIPRRVIAPSAFRAVWGSGLPRPAYPQLAPRERHPQARFVPLSCPFVLSCSRQHTISNHGGAEKKNKAQKWFAAEDPIIALHLFYITTHPNDQARQYSK